eukprot:1144221-Pelagomonas_calceolata.AAC.2
MPLRHWCPQNSTERRASASRPSISPGRPQTSSPTSTCQVQSVWGCCDDGLFPTIWHMFRGEWKGASQRAHLLAHVQGRMEGCIIKSTSSGTCSWENGRGRMDECITKSASSGACSGENGRVHHKERIFWHMFRGEWKSASQRAHHLAHVQGKTEECIMKSALPGTGPRCPCICVSCVVCVRGQTSSFHQPKAAPEQILHTDVVEGVAEWKTGPRRAVWSLRGFFVGTLGPLHPHVFLDACGSASAYSAISHCVLYSTIQRDNRPSYYEICRSIGSSIDEERCYNVMLYSAM